MLGWSWKTLAQGKTREYFLKLNPVDARVANLGLLLLSPLPNNAPRLPLTFFNASSASRLDYDLGSQRLGTERWCFWRFTPKYTRSPPPVNSDLHRRPSYCHAAFALKQISKVTNAFPLELTHTHTTLLFFVLLVTCVFQGARERLRTFFSLVVEILEGIYSLFEAREKELINKLHIHLKT